MTDTGGTAAPAGPVRLQEVARDAGVSLATASRVLNGSARTVAEAYRERVERSAARLGYAANVSAQATARGTSAMVALLVADIADPYFGQIAAGVVRGGDEAGLAVTVAITDRDPAREARSLRAFRAQRPRGIVLATSRSAATPDAVLRAELDAIAAFGGRVVALGPGLSGVRTLLIDNRGGAEALGRALAGRGYRRALVLAGPEGVRTSDDRVDGFCAGFCAGGGRLPRVLRGQLTRESGSALAARALAEGVAAGTLVFAISDAMAMGALSAVRASGRRVGDDLAVAGFGDIPAARDVTPGLTTVHLPAERVGYAALRAAVDDAWEQPAPVLPAVVLRDSTPLVVT